MRPQVKLTIIVSVLGLSLASNGAFLVGSLRGGGTARESPTAHQAADGHCLLDRLALDAAQQRRLVGMRRAMHAKRSAFWQRATTIKAELAEAICAARADTVALDPLLDRYARNQAAMQRAVANHLLGVNAMLRPEQRDAFRGVLRTGMFRGIRSSRRSPAGGR